MDCDPCRLSLATRSLEVGMGDGFTAASRPGPRSQGEGSGALQDTALSLSPGPSPSAPASRRPEGLEGPREKATNHLSPAISAARTTALLIVGGAGPRTARTPGLALTVSR